MVERTRNDVDEGVQEADSKPIGRRVKILFPTPLPKAFDYLAGREIGDLSLGSFVIAPFAGRERIGVVWALSDDAAQYASDEDLFPLEKLKPIKEKIDAPPLSASLMRFIEWTAAYAMAPLGSVLRLVIRGGDALSPPKPTPAFSKAASADLEGLRLTPGREAVLQAISETPASINEIAKRAGVSDGVVRGLAKAGGLTSVLVDPDPPFDPPAPDGARPQFSPDQSVAVEKLLTYVRAGEKPVLLDGVTGAGKTEVYLEAVAEALRRDPDAQALILIPEIALTLPFLKRIEARFGATPAAWHSELGSAARRRVWRRVADGNARIVVGARSAIFLPYKNLKLIVVDEEHETAYKQDDVVVYQGRDLAVARGVLDKFPVVLVSATPSLETVVNVDQERYEIVRLKSRFGGAQMPDVALTDLRKNPPEKGAWLSPPLVEGVNDALADGRQALLFLNRRGYAPLTICRKCGERIKSPHSDTWLVEHRFEKKLVCHHTGFSMPKPTACPSCKALDSLAPCGPGVERVAEEADVRWPDKRIAVLSSDTAPTAVAMREILDAMAAGDIDILIATQMVAKGHHFPNLTFVGVIDADMGLSGGDLRAGERTFQLLSQVAGRAGRSTATGRALLQTHQPEAPVLQALKNGDRDAFLAAEAEGRETLGYPPYGRLAAIILRSQNEQVLKETAAAHQNALFPADGVSVMGPAPAPLYRLRGYQRMRFLVKTRRDVHIQRFLEEWLSKVKLPNAVRRRVDIDPYSFL